MADDERSQPEIYIEWTNRPSYKISEPHPAMKLIEVWVMFVDGKHQADFSTREAAINCANMEREYHRKRLASREYV